MLEAAGRDTMRGPHPSRKRRRQLDDLLREIPELAVVIDTFEQRVQHPVARAEADALYSGSRNQARARWLLARTHIRVADQRRDFHFKLARRRCGLFDFVCFEDLNIAAMKRL